MLQWQQRLEDPGAFGRWTTEAIRPLLTEWVAEVCRHCGAVRDTARHTLEACPAWAEEHRALAAVMGDDLSLWSLIEGMLEREDKWRAVSFFCEAVMRREEKAEKVRRGESLAPAQRGPRGLAPEISGGGC
ncbi:uncharacterized protein LOC112552380 [Pogonomyrmex barbatus]|uniref:Uncharacterized protein LOC112552380 n=1 Tax=Pogonomyrmex barbatus TaxID=144034 RepID=A0A8N1S3B0_9HYME|nr:uncharacterized protein LOC112552380 [Pogonomyrmex barbatus]